MQLEQIIAEEDDEDRGYITAKDFMNDFATQEFLDKNVRVRPMSAKGGVDDDGKTNDMFGKSMNGDKDDENDEKME